MSEWKKCSEDTSLENGTYYCAYGTGPYIGLFTYNYEKGLHPLVEGVQILEWKRAAESPYQSVQEFDNEEYRLWHNAADGMPTSEGKYFCRYLHNYKTGLLDYCAELDNPWGGNNVVTHYMGVE